MPQAPSQPAGRQHKAPSSPPCLPCQLTAKGILHAKHLHPAVEHADAAPVGVVVLRAFRGTTHTGGGHSGSALRSSCAWWGRQHAGQLRSSKFSQFHNTGSKPLHLLQQVVDIQIHGCLPPLMAARPAAREPLPLLHACRCHCQRCY